MKIDAEPVLFSLKCFAAAMLAYYVALEIGLTRPYWAVTTTYITAQPLAGAVISKAVFRTFGTILGATAAVVLVPAFVNAPMVLSFALALWLGLCLYIAQLDRTPRAYTFLLAGYTASIIGFPSVNAPGTIFNTSILRVEEILIGIVAAAFVHGVIFPRTVTHRLFARVDAILADAERWSRGSLTRDRVATLAKERSGLAVGLAELLQLSVHLPFDTARILPRVRTVRALEDQLSMMLPLASTVEDRIDAIAATPDGRTHYWLSYKFLLRGADGQKRLGGLSFDITDRKATESEHERLISELREALAQVKTLSGFIPICASCKNIRDDAGYWQQIEQYLSKHSDLEFTHGICPACLEKLYPEFAARQRGTGS